MADVRTISAEAAASLGFSSADIVRAQGSQDGLLGEMSGTVYHLNIEFKDFHINMGTVEMPDQMGEGNSRPRHRNDY